MFARPASPPRRRPTRTCWTTRQAQGEGGHPLRGRRRQGHLPDRPPADRHRGHRRVPQDPRLDGPTPRGQGEVRRAGLRRRPAQGRRPRGQGLHRLGKMVSLDYAATEQAFLEGKGAMYPMGSWFAAAGDKSAIKDDIGVFSWPTDDGAPWSPSTPAAGSRSTPTPSTWTPPRSSRSPSSWTKDQPGRLGQGPTRSSPRSRATPRPADMGPVYKATCTTCGREAHEGQGHRQGLRLGDRR